MKKDSMEDIERITIDDNEPYLRQISEEVDFKDLSYLEDIKKLEYFCTHNRVFAMAAVQIGIPKRIIYLKNTTLDDSKYDDLTYNEKRIFINPVILSRKGRTRYLEACASCIDYAGVVERPYEIEVEYYKEDGTKTKEILEGFISTVFSHEYDHLNGVLHIDIAKETMRMNVEERKKYREEHPYEILNKTEDFES
ncbi:MAG: peptide deformylase [Bacilli bacterium]|nr:peptide deformylase [Bacilli bacterium]